MYYRDTNLKSTKCANGICIALLMLARGVAYAGYAWTDNPISTGTTRVRAVHINELRSQVASQLSNFGFSAPTWTNDPVSAPTSLYVQKITIDHTKVSGTANLSNFTVLISTTKATLATTGSGGHVGKSDGTDIYFTGSDGATKYNHEIDSYTATTGKLMAWVQIPTLSYASDTVIYMYYGNAASGNQQNVSGTWDSGYLGVWHFPDGTTLSATDSTSNGNNGITSGHAPTATTGQIDGAANFNGTTQWVDTTLSPNPSAITLETWFSSTETARSIAMIDNFRTSPSIAGATLRTTGTDIDFVTGGPAANDFIATGGLVANTKYFVAGSFDSATQVINVFVNGTVGYTTTLVGGSIGAGTNFNIGRSSRTAGMYLPGMMDEVRISSVARSADWIKTEYNNENSPSTFISFGAESPPTSGTLIRVVHISELRVQISSITSNYNSLCSSIVGATPSWTDSSLSSGTSRIRAIHLTELRAASDSIGTCSDCCTAKYGACSTGTCSAGAGCGLQSNGFTCAAANVFGACLDASTCNSGGTCVSHPDTGGACNTSLTPSSQCNGVCSSGTCNFSSKVGVCCQNSGCCVTSGGTAGSCTGISHACGSC